MAEKYEENEQWKHGGDCRKCRRNNYCKNACTVRNRIEKANFRNSIKNLMNEMTGGSMSALIDNAVDGINI